MKDYKIFRSKLLKNQEVKKAYKKLGLEFELIRKLIEKRIKKGVTQKELALAIGTKQSAISRFESGSYSPTLSFLIKVSDVLDMELRAASRTKK